LLLRPSPRVLPGSGASAVLLEQRLCDTADRGELWRRAAHYVPSALQDLQGALEPDDRRPRLQRPQDLHGDE